jgi:hypothetical protein
MRYRIIGEDRQLGAPGVLEPFSITVKAATPDEASDVAIKARSDIGREHVRCLQVRALTK